MSCKVWELGTGLLRLESEELSVYLKKSEDMMSQRSRYLQGRGERSRQHGGVRRSGEGRL
jgi:hypothetical protein